ncbi:hypothetical protein GCM10027073_67360 [Streptomyces chlorus]
MAAAAGAAAADGPRPGRRGAAAGGCDRQSGTEEVRPSDSPGEDDPAGRYDLARRGRHG